MSKDPSVGGMGEVPACLAWDGHRAARKASWRGRGLKNQPKPQVKKARTESQAERQKVEARRREGKAEREQKWELQAGAGSEGAAGTWVQAAPRVTVSACV